MPKNDPNAYAHPAKWPSVEPDKLPPYARPPMRCLYWQEQTKHEQALDRVHTLLERFARRCAELSYIDERRALGDDIVNIFQWAMGSTYPYVFERHTGRWPDGLYHLVDRGYTPLAKDCGVTLAQLRAVGVVDWNRSKFCKTEFSNSCLAVVDPCFRIYPESLRALAGVVQSSASLFDPEPARTARAKAAATTEGTA